MRRAIAREEQERRSQDRFASTLVIAALGREQQAPVRVCLVPLFDLGEQIVGDWHVAFFRGLHAKLVVRFARNPQHLVIQVNVGPFEMNNLLLAQAALQSQTNDQPHVRAGTLEDVGDLFPGVDRRQGLVVAGHGRKDLGSTPAKRRKLAARMCLFATVRSAEPRLRSAEFEEVFTADLVDISLLDRAQELGR